MINYDGTGAELYNMESDSKETTNLVLAYPKEAEKLKTKPFNQVASASGAYGFKTGQTKFFKSADQLDNLGAAQIFWDTAKKLKENQISDIFSNPNGFYIIKLKAIKPVDENKYVKDKKELSDNLLSREKTQFFGKFVEEIKKKAQ